MSPESMYGGALVPGDVPPLLCPPGLAWENPGDTGRGREEKGKGRIEGKGWAWLEIVTYLQSPLCPRLGGAT